MFLESALIFILGTVFGSFLNVVVYRLPHKKSLLGRSACVSCKKELSWYSLIPLLSFIGLRGKCANCHAPFSMRYFWVEFASGLLFVLSFMASGFSFWDPALLDLVYLIWLLLISCLSVVVFLIDLDHYLILDEVVLFGFVGLGLLSVAYDLLSNATFSSGLFLSGMIMTFVLSALFYFIWLVSKGKWLGFGDVKFMGVFCMALGFPYGFFGLGLASILGSIVGIGLLFGKKMNMQSKLPFGVFLSLAMIITALYGERLWQAYLLFIQQQMI